MFQRQVLTIAVGLVAIVALACSSSASAPEGADEPSGSNQQPTTAPPAPASPTSAPQGGPTAMPEPTSSSQSEATAVPPSPSTPQAGPTPALTATPESASTSPPEPTPTASPEAEVPLADAVTDGLPDFMKLGWKTDFSKHSVPFSEIRSGGPRRDGIPPIDNPRFIDVANPPDYMKDNEPVISVEINGEAKAYPLAILVSHEIVNDELGGIPITVSFCPLCNTAIVFDRRVGGEILDFGTSGNLRLSDLVMWDRQTESWWQQITGEAIVGELTGTKLTFLPAPLISWNDFRTSFPQGQVLSRETGFGRIYNYDIPPYGGYDALNRNPFLFSGDFDDRLKPMERVVSLTIGDEAVAYPFEFLMENPVVNDTVSGKDVVVFYVGGTLSPFAGPGASENRTVGSTGVFDPVVEGQKLTFGVRGNVIVDDETETTWNILGQGVVGPLKGTQLTPIVHANHFWFAWFAFNPETAVRSIEDFSG